MPDVPISTLPSEETAREEMLRDKLLRAGHGDHGAFAQVWRACQDRIFNVLFRLCGDGDEAAELTHDTFVRALERVDKYAAEEIAPCCWLLRIAVGAAVVSLRRSRRRREFTGAMDSADPVHMAVAQGLGRLEADYRIALVLHDIDGLDYFELSNVLDLPAEQVQSRLFRARLALRDELRGGPAGETLETEASHGG